MTAPTGVGKGGAREGAGRPPGVAGINHKARKLIVQAARNGDLMPLDLLLAVVRDEAAPRRERLQAAAIAAPYCHPKLTAQVTAYLDPDKLSDEELLRSIAHLEKLVGVPEPPPPNDQPGAVVRHEDWLPLRRPDIAPAPSPEPVEGRHLLYDPRAAKMVSRSS
jgi:hypothetical protein